MHNRLVSPADTTDLRPRLASGLGAIGLAPPAAERAVPTPAEAEPCAVATRYDGAVVTGYAALAILEGSNHDAAIIRTHW